MERSDTVILSSNTLKGFAEEAENQGEALRPGWLFTDVLMCVAA